MSIRLNKALRNLNISLKTATDFLLTLIPQHYSLTLFISA